MNKDEELKLKRQKQAKDMRDAIGESLREIIDRSQESTKNVLNAAYRVYTDYEGNYAGKE